LLLGRHRGLALLAGFAAGLGTITKGVGFLPLLLLVPWRLLPAARRGAGSVHGGWIALGFAAGCMVWLGPLLWTAAAGADPAVRDYLADILLRQTVQRYADPWHHLQPPWYYAQVLATLWLPGVLLFPWLLPAWLRRWRRGDPRFILLLAWAMLLLLFFSATSGKRGVYIFPALPAVCLAAAPLLRALLRRAWPRRVPLGYLALMALALLGAGAVLGMDLMGVAARVSAERALAPPAVHHVAFPLMLMGAG